MPDKIPNRSWADLKETAPRHLFGPFGSVGRVPDTGPYLRPLIAMQKPIESCLQSQIGGQCWDRNSETASQSIVGLLSDAEVVGKGLDSLGN